MSARQTIDSMHFARSGGWLSGELHGGDLPRLADILARESPCVQYLLSGGMKSGRPVLHLEIQATVRLVCQRCLESYQEVLALQRGVRQVS